MVWSARFSGFLNLADVTACIIPGSLFGRPVKEIRQIIQIDSDASIIVFYGMISETAEGSISLTDKGTGDDA